MPEVTISVKVDGKELIHEARFDSAGNCCAAVNARGEDLTKLAKKSQAERPADEEVKFRMGLEMLYTNPCCWFFINGKWRCLPCD